MKTTIMMKLMAVMLLLTVIPLALLGYIALQDSRALGLSVAGDAESIGDEAITDSTTALKSLGEVLIKEKGLDVARQMDIYIHDHPSMTLAQLQNDPYFISIANQQIGETGYTVIIDTASTDRVFHPNPKMVNVSMITSAQVDKQPGYQEIVDKLQAGQETYGYYTYKDPNTGAQRPKYMYIARLDQPTADGVRMGVMSTTFIDEFSQPATKTEAAIKAKLDSTMNQIKVKTESVGTQNTILFVTFATIIIVIIVSYFFALTIVRPVKRLTEIATTVSMGRLDEEIDINTNDEINDLAESLRRMINAFKMMVALLESQEGKK